MTVLVTGATGFVGSHVVRQLVASGEDVAVLVRPGSSRERLAGVADRVQFLEADLADGAAIAGLLKACKPEACVHAAWYAEPGKYLTSVQNLDSLRSSFGLLETLAEAGCTHVVGVGTCFEYDVQTKGSIPHPSPPPAGEGTARSAGEDELQAKGSIPHPSRPPAGEGTARSAGEDELQAKGSIPHPSPPPAGEGTARSAGVTSPPPGREGTAQATPLTEESLVRPFTLYAAAKLAFYLVAAQRAAQLDMGFAWARLFYLYGPFEDERRLVPAMIKALTARQEFPGTSGEQVRDYLHVEDVASGLCALSRHRLSGVFNVSSGEAVTIADLMRTLGELLGRPDLIRLGTLPNREWDPAYICGDNHKLRTAAGWAPRYALRDGLAQTIEWWKQTR